MTIYEIDERLRFIDSALTPDENGEFSLSTEEMIKLDEEGQKLAMTRQEKLENLTKWYFNLLSESVAYKTESDRLKKHADHCANKAESLKNYIRYCCNGENMNLGIANAKFSESKPLEVTDEEKAIQFLQDEGHEECIRYKAPEIAKDEVKKLIKSGIEVPGTQIITKTNFNIK